MRHAAPSQEKDEAAKLMGSKFSHEQRELLKAVVGVGPVHMCV